ncbi:MAG TPA: tetratricopeptide repeat protein [Polyangia bacterium]|jgi:tetratricopeptide (TPR) repeat protein
MRIRDLLLGTLLVLGTAPTARADGSRDVARAHYARGVELAGKNGYAEALQEFNQAYIVSPEFAVLYNIGQCHIALGHPAEAIEALSRYLRDGAERIPRARRELVQQQIEMMEARGGGAPVPEPDPASASTAEARETARAHRTRGLELAGRNQYGAALREFDDAYATDPDFGILYNIGQCHVALGHPVEAIEAFSRYLRDGAERVPSGRADLLGAQIVMLESRLAELTIVTVGPDARVLLDGRELGRAPLAHPLRIGSGSYRITVIPDVGPPVIRDVTLAEAQRLTLTVRLPFLPASWSPAVAARVTASAAAATRAATAAAVANEQALVEKARSATSQQGGSGSSQGGTSNGGGH